jgi:hypothetical protein
MEMRLRTGCPSSNYRIASSIRWSNVVIQSFRHFKGGGGGGVLVLGFYLELFVFNHTKNEGYTAGVQLN